MIRRLVHWKAYPLIGMRPASSASTSATRICPAATRKVQSKTGPIIPSE
ncbi:hypothetical protein [Acrocarpospora corrugata]|nr:hypothetical protein [Acrocarpospora corrugata]